MSLEQTAPEQIRHMLKPVENGRFRFACHPEVPCFTECCRDLELLLTPYDVLRLKKRLGLTATAFLDKYTQMEVDERRGIPMPLLLMSDNERGTCPFVSALGCRIYEDRPAACRTYPLARATRFDRVHEKIREDFFVLQESHCRGFEEDREWSIEDWTRDQGLEPYHEMDNLWMQIITHARLQQGQPLSERQAQMFLTACYNLDKFREMVTGSRLLQIFDLPPDEATAIRDDDEALLRLAFKWISFSLLNEPQLTLRQPPCGDSR